MTSVLLSYETMARDYLTFRSVNAKRKSAVEILQETKSLFVKSEAVLDAEQRLSKAPKCDGSIQIASESSNRKDPTLAKVRRKIQPTHTRSCSDQLQTNLRRLLNSSKENVADVHQDGVWHPGQIDSIGFFEFNHDGETDIQYQSLPDLSASSRESLSSTIQRAVSDSKQSNFSRSNDDVDMSSESNTSIDESIESSEKSYGKPPSMPKSLQSMGGSFGKLEERLTTWSEPKHVRIVRSRSSTGANDDLSTSKLPHQPSLPADLNEFFQHLGLTSDQYNDLTAADSRSSSPMFFSSRGSVESTDRNSTTRRTQRSSSPPAPSPVSVVQTNARVVKWLCKTSQWL